MKIHKKFPYLIILHFWKRNKQFKTILISEPRKNIECSAYNFYCCICDVGEKNKIWCATYFGKWKSFCWWISYFNVWHFRMNVGLRCKANERHKFDIVFLNILCIFFSLSNAFICDGIRHFTFQVWKVSVFHGYNSYFKCRNLICCNFFLMQQCWCYTLICRYIANLLFKIQ